MKCVLLWIVIKTTSLLYFELDCRSKIQKLSFSSVHKLFHNLDPSWNRQFSSTAPNYLNAKLQNWVIHCPPYEQVFGMSTTVRANFWTDLTFLEHFLHQNTCLLVRCRSFGPVHTIKKTKFKSNWKNPYQIPTKLDN